MELGTGLPWNRSCTCRPHPDATEPRNNRASTANNPVHPQSRRNNVRTDVSSDKLPGKVPSIPGPNRPRRGQLFLRRSVCRKICRRQKLKRLRQLCRPACSCPRHETRPWPSGWWNRPGPWSRKAWCDHSLRAEKIRIFYKHSGDLNSDHSKSGYMLTL